MLKSGDYLTYNGGYVLGYGDCLEEGDLFKLSDIEKTDYHTFYWIENSQYRIVLLNDEIESFDIN